MQTKTIVIAGATSRFLSLKTNFKQIKKWLLPAALFLSFAFFAAPASAQVSINAEVSSNTFSNYQVSFTVFFTSAQTGLSPGNFTVTGTVTGASIIAVSGSGQTYVVLVGVPDNYQSSGTIILNMVNNTGVSPGVSGLPVASPSVTDVLYPLTGSATLTSFNANPGYAKTGDLIAINISSDNYIINQVSGNVANGNIASNSANGQQGGVSVTLGSGIPQGPLAYSFGFNTIYNTQGGGSGTSGIIFDSINPTVSISAPSATTVTGNGTSSVSYTVTYADANFGSSNLTASGITLNSTGSTTGTVSLSGSGTSYTVTISNIIGAGTLGISVGAGYAADLAGNTDAGAGPSSTVTVQLAQPSISYTGPNLYPINTAITPLVPSQTISISVFASTVAGTALALDYNGNAYIIASSSEIIRYQTGNGSLPLPNNSGANIAIAPISATSSTLLSAFGGAFRAMDINNGTFTPPVTVCPTSGTGNLVAVAHPASGPEIALINKGFDPGGQIAFLTRTGGTWSSPAIITNAFAGSALAINNYPGGLKLAYIGTDNNLYYATYSGGAWSAVTPWATPNISLSGVTAFALDAQGNVWYANGTSLNELAPGSTAPVTAATLPSAPNAIAFDIAGNLYVNLGTTIEKLSVINNFVISPGLPAGLTINNATGVISGTPTAVSPATNYTVSATAGGINLTAPVNIQILPPNVNLSNLSLSTGTLSPAFAQGTLTYADTVSHTTATIIVTPTAVNPTSTITVNGAAVTSGNPSAAINLNVGSGNTVTIVVTSADGTATQTYTLVVDRISSVASLANLTISSGTLTPVFNPATSSYTATVGSAVSSVTVTPTVTEPNAKMTVNGTAVTSGAASAGLPLATGVNAIKVVVTAQDGTTMRNYTINVTRPSANASLSAIVLSSGTLSPAFAFAKTSYTASVGNDVTSITLTPTTINARATITVNGNTVTSGSASAAIPLNVGANTITTIVTAQDGTTTDTYTVVVTRAASTNDNLSNLTISAGTLKPVFSTATTAYTVVVGNGISSIMVTPTTSDATASVSINGTMVTSGSASAAIPLNVGPNTITTLVTAQDGVTQQTYTLTVTRAPSANAKLLSLATSSGALTPAFNNTVTNYTRAVANTVTSITLTPTTVDPAATIVVNGVAVTSGTASGSIPLIVGSNVITTVVTAQDGVTKITYTLTVTRAGAADATLSNLAISTGTLKPGFAIATMAYTVAVGNGITSATVTPTTNDPTATVTIGGTTVISGTASSPITLAVGSNIISIVVTAQNGIATKTYKITVTRAPSNNAKLLSLTTSNGALSPAFNNTVTSYTRAVPNSATTITFTPTVVDKTATVTVNGTTTASGTASAAQPLVVGSNTVNIKVTAQDGVTVITYVVTVTRAAGALNTVYEPVSVVAPSEKPVFGDDIIVHQGLSPNGDGINDFLQIDGILAFPDNKLQVMNRSGQLVFETKGYDNSSKVFDGHSNKNGTMQLPGTYFYSLDYAVKGEIKHKTGFIILKY